MFKIFSENQEALAADQNNEINVSPLPEFNEPQEDNSYFLFSLFHQLLIDSRERVITHDVKIMCLLSMTCKKLNTLFNPKLDSSRLIHFVLAANDEAVEQILKTSPPEFIFLRGCGNDPIGRYYANVTALEAALLCGDFQMANKIEPYFKKLRAQEKQRLQCHHIFPEGDVKAVIEAQKSFHFDKIMNAISIATKDELKNQLCNIENNSPLCCAMNTFRKEFKDLSLEEKMFNLKHLLKAYEIYKQQRDNGWELLQLQLFLIQIIGYIQICLPEWVKQLFYQGFEDYVRDVQQSDKPMNNRLLTMNKPNEALSLTFNSPSGAGFEYTILGFEIAISYTFEFYMFGSYKALDDLISYTINQAYKIDAESE